jgi:hypothetical protein
MHVPEHSLHCPLCTHLAVVPIGGVLVPEVVSRTLLVDPATADRHNTSQPRSRVFGGVRTMESLP